MLTFDEFPLVHKLLHLVNQRASLVHLLTQELASGEVYEVIILKEILALGSFAASRPSYNEKDLRQLLINGLAHV